MFVTDAEKQHRFYVRLFSVEKQSSRFNYKQTVLLLDVMFYYMLCDFM